MVLRYNIIRSLGTVLLHDRGPVITSQGGLIKELCVTKVFLCEMIIHTMALQPTVVESNASSRCAYNVTNVCTALKLHM